METITLLGAL